MTPPPSVQMHRPYLNEFRSFPQVDEILITYFDEITKATDNNLRLRLAPSILIGAMSELIILRLLDAIGKLLEDPNALSNYKNRHRTPERKMQYTRTMVQNGRNRLNEIGGLPQNSERFFVEFENIVPHIFDAIRLKK
jgi:hypothetical protein